jgi:phosphoglycolate phosphatase-like HAD superfamily hydrolase
MDMEHRVLVRHSVWDLLAAQRAHALGVGLLARGYGENELARVGACRVYRDPEDLLEHLDEIGVKVEET